MIEAPWRYYSPDEIAALSLKYADRGNIGVAFTYNEPLISYENIMDCADLIHEQNQRTVLVTNGYINHDPLRMALPKIDAMNIDLKAFSNRFYLSVNGNLETVKNAIETSANACHTEITALIIPGQNDSAEEMEGLSNWLAGIGSEIPLHITRFFPRYRMSGAEPTSLETLKILAGIAKRRLRHVYLGNC